MTRTTGPDCAVMCNLINTHTHTDTHTPQPEAYTTRIFCQAYDALQVAPASDPHSEALANDLERATKLFHITQALIQSSDGRCSRQGSYDEYTRGEPVGLIHWLMVFAGRSQQKARDINLKLGEYDQASQHMREEASPRPRAP